jgi:hypothetical protein
LLILKHLWLLVSIALLTACGGGGSSSAPAPAPATPPVISSLQFTPSSAAVNAGGGLITISASLSFTDSGGDLANITLNVFDVANVQVDAITRAVSGATGVTSGTINATVQAGTGLAGQYSIQVTATDAGGAKSNTLVSTFLVGSPGTFVRTGNLSTSRGICSMTLLNDGKVLLCAGTTNGYLGSGGGALVSGADVYDPATGRWTPTTGGMLVPRASNFATLLQSGKVLVAGAWTSTTWPPPAASCTTRRPRASAPRGAWARSGQATPPWCLPMGRCWQRVAELRPMSGWIRRKFTIPPPTPGHPPAAWARPGGTSA